MGVTIGIDLGTTNCCIGVLASAEIPRKEQLIADGRLRRAGAVLVITDEYRAPTTPSAVWMGPDGEPVVGALAKDKARIPGEPPPAMFFKRSMGTDEQFTAGHAQLTAQEAATHLLRHLKRLAEQTLGVPVERAIVTVPAFFETSAKNATTRAGADAGLEIVQTLLEPVAAALTYVYDRIDTLTEPSTFLVYDLGGGTFDASVVAWDPDGDFDHRGFHGDRFLGGYDFDQAMVEWLAGQLPGFALKFETTDSEHAKLLNTLLVDAEMVKIELSRTQVGTFLRQGVSDCAGTPMIINLPMERRELHQLIEADIHRTMDLCDQALEQAGVAAGSLHEVVMVGGSSRIPLVGELLEQRYGRRPLLSDPDLCVGIGAALKIAALVEPSEYLELAKPVVAEKEADIAGKVRTGSKLSSPAHQRLVLSSADERVRMCTLSSSDGTFFFREVPLAEGENDFIVELVVADEPIDTQAISIVTDAPPPPDFHGGILTNDYFVGVKQGLEKVAEAGTKVPYNSWFPLYTANQGTTLVVPVIEGRHGGLIPIGELAIDGLSRDLPVGTPVEVRLHFTADWEIDAEVKVPSVGRSATAHMLIKPTEVDSWDQLRHRFVEIDAAWQEKRQLVTAAVGLTHGPIIADLRQDVEDLLNQGLDRTKANYKLTALETAVGMVPIGPGAGLKPSLASFEDDLAVLTVKCDQLAERQEQRAAEFREEIPRLRANGMAAYEAENQQLWSRAVAAVEGQIDAIEAILHPRPSWGGDISPEHLQLLLLQQVDTGRTKVQETNRETQGDYQREASLLLAEGDRLGQLIGSVNVQAADARSRLRTIQNDQLARWHAAVTDFPSGGIIDVVARR